MTDEKMVLVHPWQDKGLGKAPFRLVSSFHYVSAESFGFNVAGYNRAMAEAAETARHYGVHGGICDVCGMSLMNNYIIKSADNKYFVVGCDCVGKAGDSKLMTEVQAKERDRKRQLRREKAQAEREARRVAYEAELKAQRERNGGLTDYEVGENARLEKIQKEQAQHEADNQWLIEVLERAFQGDFVNAMISKLRKEPFNNGYFSRGQYNAIVNVFCHGYRGKERDARAEKISAKFESVTGEHPSWRS